MHFRRTTSSSKVLVSTHAPTITALRNAFGEKVDMSKLDYPLPSDLRAMGQMSCDESLVCIQVLPDPEGADGAMFVEARIITSDREAGDLAKNADAEWYMVANRRLFVLQ